MIVTFYGRLGDRLGRQIDVEAAPGCSVGDLRRMIADRFPEAADELLGAVRACVADEIVTDAAIVDGRQNIEFFPPVSGG